MGKDWENKIKELILRLLRIWGFIYKAKVKYEGILILLPQSSPKANDKIILQE